MNQNDIILNVGTVLHGDKEYTIKRMLGQGGFGISYEATATFTDGNIRQKVHYAIKEFFMEDICCRMDGEVRPKEGQEEKFNTFLEHFAKEAERIRVTCKHPGVVSVNEVFKDRGTSYYVMAFLDGETLESRVKKCGALPEDEMLVLVKSVGDALSFLHSTRMNHLDVKPENIMLVKDENDVEQPILIDFGLSRHFKKNGSPTSVYATLGCSDGYSPLEQYAGIDKFSPEADVYALAATAVFMVTGKTPCCSKEMSMQWIRTNLPANLSIETSNALIEGLRSIASERCASIEEFLGLLPMSRILKGESSKTKLIDATKALKTGRKDGKTQNYRIIGVISAIVAIILVIGVVLNLISTDTEDNQPNDQTPTLSQIPKQEIVVKDSVTPINEEPATTAVASNQNIQSSSTMVQTESQQPKSDTLVSSNNPDVSNEPTTKRIDLGYAVYEGAVKKKLPHGKGSLTFKESHLIDSFDPEKRQAEAGDVIEGFFLNGHLDKGLWKKNDGTEKRILIGTI